MRLAQAELVHHPVVEGVAVVVLGGTERVGDTFEGIDDWAGEIIDRIGLIGIKSVIMSPKLHIQCTFFSWQLLK